MPQSINIPSASYGVMERDKYDCIFDELAEQVRRVGYAILDGGYSEGELGEVSEKFNVMRSHYVDFWGEENLRSLNEYHVVRAPLIHGDSVFLRLAMNSNLLAVLKKLIAGKFILNQQNGVINPPGETYSQGAWHRDLPYQHYVSSSPLAVNALFCVDDFTFDNGSTFVLPASHKSGAFPSDGYIQRNALQVEAKSGQYILLDCMLFHSGGFNASDRERRAVNHVYTIPSFKQQINLPKNVDENRLNTEEKQLLGFYYQEPESIRQYLFGRDERKKF